jgi:hypothetical protein
LREECYLRGFENKVLRRIFGPRRDEVRGSGKDYITRSFMLCTPLYSELKKTEMDRACSTYGWTGEVHTEF